MKTIGLIASSVLAFVAVSASAQTSSLTNSSTRGIAGSGDNTMISGFVVNAPAGQLRWVLVRGIGPTLSTFGVAGPLADPAVQIRSRAGNVIAVNENFGTAPNLALLNTVTGIVGAFPVTNEKESALLIGVPAGIYTVQLHTNAAVEARPALLEVYEAGAVPAGMTSQTLSGLAASNPNLSTLATALRITGLDATLSAGGPYTVFAPTNAAFDKLPAATLNSLIADPAALTQVLLFHVANGQVLSSQLTNGQSITTLRAGARPLVINLTNGAKVDNSAIVAADVRAQNGVVHVIDTVLLP